MIVRLQERCKDIVYPVVLTITTSSLIEVPEETTPDEDNEDNDSGDGNEEPNPPEDPEPGPGPGPEPPIEQPPIIPDPPFFG